MNCSGPFNVMYGREDVEITSLRDVERRDGDGMEPNILPLFGWLSVTLRLRSVSRQAILHNLRWLSGAEASSTACLREPQAPTTPIPSSTFPQETSHQSPPAQNRCL